MNTADRSIALVDAALRRRFHFIPFFPNEGAVEGLLSRWLEDKQPDSAWVADLVDMVNGDLTQDLGGPDLQIGPSYFMQPDLTEAKVDRIWRYSIHPFIADQLYGQQKRIEWYEFSNVLKRFRALSGTEDDGDDVDSASEAE